MPSLKIIEPSVKDDALERPATEAAEYGSASTPLGAAIDLIVADNEP
jgi:hypothetical protein